MNLLATKKNVPINLGQRKNTPFWSTAQNEFNKAFNNIYEWFEPFSSSIERFEDLSLCPAVDVVDEKNQLKIEIEMPGLGEEDIKVSIDNGILTVKGEKTTSRQDKDKNYMMREINYGSYERSLSLPDTVDTDKAKASFKKGMLWVVLPKKPECTKESKTIEVEKVL
ncbi:heat shock protein Hsp20 [Allofrancisella inopinata]|uniref:Hsp20/alpha crystallin family protein n=1 Tax=Allofrancisella inopinata TaxID=1085647 RepID=A0AAE7CQN6_9GAMM|nr:Hsp20/alpha crystallin family protein [Allofrancisella inopinata]QIV95942.1 Hsp20/alpha crystallin family protein [Allofrancisella inopinata]TDT74362.1 heat shock protein Hsp20 [Allofrancisella inopinata]